MVKKLLILYVLMFSITVSAEQVTKITTISELYAYGTYGTNNTNYRNDVQIRVEETVVGCEGGFYISSDDAQSNPALVSFLLSAFHSSSNVKFSAYTDQLWDGSSAKYCRINSIALVK